MFYLAFMYVYAQAQPTKKKIIIFRVFSHNNIPAGKQAALRLSDYLQQLISAGYEARIVNFLSVGGIKPSDEHFHSGSLFCKIAGNYGADLALCTIIDEFNLTAENQIIPDSGAFVVSTAVIRLNFFIYSVQSGKKYNWQVSGTAANRSFTLEQKNDIPADSASLPEPVVYEDIGKIIFYPFSEHEFISSLPGQALRKALRGFTEEIAGFSAADYSVLLRIMDLDRDYIYINAGTDHNLETGQIVDIIRKNENSEIKQIGKIKIDAVLAPALSRAVLINAGISPEKNDLVILPGSRHAPVERPKP